MDFMCFASLPCFVAFCSSLYRHEAEGAACMWGTKQTLKPSWPDYFWLILLPGAVSGLCWLPGASRWRFSLPFPDLLWRLRNMWKDHVKANAFRDCLYLYKTQEQAQFSLPGCPVIPKVISEALNQSGQRMILQLKITIPFPRKTR